MIISKFPKQALLTYAQVLAAISYTGTFSSEEKTYAATGKYAVIKFLTSGTLTLAKNLLTDIFLVGGGGGGASSCSQGAGGSGGGGGYTTTAPGQSLLKGTPYPVQIGAGGNGGEGDTDDTVDHPGAVGGTSKFNNVYTAAGGKGAPITGNGANGGCGGGTAGAGSNATTDTGGNGGSDGSDGTTHNTLTPGVGQHTTTKEFEEPDGVPYAGGGGGGGADDGTYGRGGLNGGGNGGGGNGDSGAAGLANYGGGGGGASDAFYSSLYSELWCGSGGKGGSGAVLMRVRIA